MRTFWVVIFLLFGMAWYALRGWMPISRPPGVLVAREPEQELFDTARPPLRKKEWTLKPLANYTLEGRVLGMATYSGTENPGDELSPYDIAVGWGRMSDTAVLEKLDLSVSNRFFRWQYWGNAAPIPEKEMITHSANMHLIPETDRIKERIAALRVGSVVQVSGYLVEATHPKAVTPWRSSLTRDDTGDGACELMYVRTIRELSGLVAPLHAAK